MISDHPTAIEEMVNTFQNQQMPNVNQETQSWILMEILGAIPEEVNTFTFFAVQRVNIYILFRLFTIDKCNVHFGAKGHNSE